MERTSENNRSTTKQPFDHPVAPKVNESDRDMDSIVHKKPPRQENFKQPDPQSQSLKKSSARRSRSRSPARKNSAKRQEEKTDEEKQPKVDGICGVSNC